jgi:hypothetical protein
MGFEILPPKENGVDWFEERQCPNCRRLESEIARLEAELKEFQNNLERCREMYIRDAD